MYLKKLELYGFKSFADKTEFEFGSGMTGIVGPNGCGKSNVVDAFKWMFGEQSAKGLRGAEMKDVIFSGTQKRKPSGYSEVTAVFDNSDRFFDVDYSELAITRRLFRSGESVYLINRQKSRLKDIKALLMGTGMGATSYSIFEQGKIDVLLHASSEDRRIIFEEAAGISKYRARKNEALRALARTEDNLARAGDIISELEKQRQRLRIQAGRARKYREYSTNLKRLRIRIAVSDYTESVSGRGELTYQRYYLDFHVQRLQGLLDRLGGGLDEYSRKRSQQADKVRALSDDLSGARTRRERTEESIEHNQRRLGELENELVRRRGEFEETEGAVTEVRGELERERSDHERLLGVVGDCRDALEESLRKLEVLRRDHDDLRQHHESVKRSVVERFDDGARTKNDLVQLESEISNLAGRRTRLENQIAATRDESGELGQRQASVETELGDVRRVGVELEAQRTTLEERRADLEGRFDQAVGKVAATEGEIRAAQSRLEVLETFEENLDGVAQGVAALLNTTSEGDVQEDGVQGLLAHLIDVDRPFALAVEAALGVRSQALVVAVQDGALRLIHRARELKAGAVEVISLDRVEALPADDIPVEAEVLGTLRQKVRTRNVAHPGVGALLDRLLGNVVLVRDLPTALALTRNGLRNYRVVTLDGELLEPLGALSVAGDSTTGLISRRSEMRDLRNQLDELAGDSERLRESQRLLETERSSAEEELSGVALRREEVGLRLAALDGQLEQLDKERARLARVLAVSESECADVLRELESRAGEKERLDRKFDEIELQRRCLELESRDFEERLLHHGEAVQVVAEDVTEAKVSLAESEKREEGQRRAVQQLGRSLAEREARYATLTSDIADLSRRVDATASDLEKAGELLVSIQTDEASLLQSVEEAGTEETRLNEVNEAFRQEIETVREDLDERRSAREQINLKDQEGVLRRRAILEGVTRDYAVDIAELIDRALAKSDDESSAVSPESEESEGHEVDGETLTPTTDSPSIANSSSSDEVTQPSSDASPDEAREAVSGEETGDDEAEPSLEELIRGWIKEPDEEWDYDVATEEADELNEKIRRLGSVNLEALNELDEADERLVFHTAQRDDLQNAERDLRQIIGEINKASRELFSNTFAEVQKNFSEIFEKCFGGGKAELVLEDNVDVLEAGIEIVARPPGKKLTSLTLMSGGEKTMTTIALMFAIFKARPSPFCLLDEVDAALDENNVRRFVVLLQEFLGSTQFIIITHNKISMAVADSLYGVTMEEKGVSKRVAVQFETYDPENPHESLSTTDIDAAPVVSPVVGPTTE